MRNAYPDTQVWRQGDHLWLMTTVTPVRGFNRQASVLVRITECVATVRAWAFWKVGPVGVQWIGPRHTNFPDGSICAFDPMAGIWTFGNGLVQLMDLYSLWVFRHLHLEVVGRWPGPQLAILRAERLIEFDGAELCGCGITTKKYRDCCQVADRQHHSIADAMALLQFSTWKTRCPPAEIVDVAYSRAFFAQPTTLEG